MHCLPWQKLQCWTCADLDKNFSVELVLTLTKTSVLNLCWHCFRELHPFIPALMTLTIKVKGASEVELIGYYLIIYWLLKHSYKVFLLVAWDVTVLLLVVWNVTVSLLVVWNVTVLLLVVWNVTVLLLVAWNVTMYLREIICTFPNSAKSN